MTTQQLGGILVEPALTSAFKSLSLAKRPALLIVHLWTQIAPDLVAHSKKKKKQH